MLIIVAVAVVLGGLGVIDPSSAIGPSCETAWGTQPQVTEPLSSSTLVTAVRVGQHSCYDRLVIDLAGPAQGYAVAYEEDVSEGEGLEPPGTWLIVSVAGNEPTSDFERFRPPVAGFQAFRQVGYGGSGAGTTNFFLRVRERLPFRVFTLAGPGSAAAPDTQARVVVDVAHSPSDAQASQGQAQPAAVPPAEPPSSAEATWITDVRSGRQTGFDRVVFEFTEGVPEYRVSYVEDPFVSVPGDAVPVSGQAFIGVRLRGTSRSNPETGEVFFAPPEGQRIGDETVKRAVTSDTRVVTEVVEISDFEREVFWVVGLSARQPFQVSTLDGPPRLVIDIPHPEPVTEEGW